MNKFTDSEFITILEIARIALANKQMFEHIAQELDLADTELEELESKLLTIAAIE